MQTLSFSYLILCWCSSDPPWRIDMVDYESGESVANGTIYAVISARHKLNCTVPSPSNPPPNITWSADGVTMEKENQENEVSAEHARLTTSWRVVSVIASQGDGGKVITCSANHFGLPAPLKAVSTLAVGSKSWSWFRNSHFNHNVILITSYPAMLLVPWEHIIIRIMNDKHYKLILSTTNYIFIFLLHGHRSTLTLQGMSWCTGHDMMYIRLFSISSYYRPLRARRALSIFKDIPLRTRRALSP